jgi:hypothetical protein
MIMATMEIIIEFQFIWETNNILAKSNTLINLNTSFFKEGNRDKN